MSAATISIGTVNSKSWNACALPWNVEVMVWGSFISASARATACVA